MAVEASMVSNDMKGLIMKADSSYIMDSTEGTATENQDEDESQGDTKPPTAQVQLLLWDDVDD
jgi:hypothetical protein